jgi:hypothetical protein
MMAIAIAVASYKVQCRKSDNCIVLMLSGTRSRCNPTGGENGFDGFASTAYVRYAKIVSVNRRSAAVTQFSQLVHEGGTTKKFNPAEGQHTIMGRTNGK